MWGFSVKSIRWPTKRRAFFFNEKNSSFGALFWIGVERSFKKQNNWDPPGPLWVPRPPPDPPKNEL